FSAVSGTTTPRFSRIRAALPARRRRKYSLARRTRPLRSSSISAIAGECSGKIRSTPTPAEIFRTVKVALIPPPRRAMHTPSNACSRSLSPSRTRTITRTVSPGSKAVRFVLSPSRSIARNRSIPSPSILVSGPQIWPPLARQSLGFGRAPPRDLLVIAAQQYRRHIHSAIARRPRVAGRREEPVVVRVCRGRLVVAERAGQQAHHRIEHAQRGRLATRQHEIADRQLFRAETIGDPLIHVLVVAAQERQLRADREPDRVPVRERPPARRQQHDGRPRPQVLHRLEERLGLEHHPRTAPVRGVVHGLVAVVRVVAQLHDPVAHQLLLCRATQDAYRH